MAFAVGAADECMLLHETVQPEAGAPLNSVYTRLFSIDSATPLLMAVAPQMRECSAALLGESPDLEVDFSWAEVTDKKSDRVAGKVLDVRMTHYNTKLRFLDKVLVQWTPPGSAARVPGLAPRKADLLDAEEWMGQVFSSRGFFARIETARARRAPHLQAGEADAAADAGQAAEPPVQATRQNMEPPVGAVIQRITIVRTTDTMSRAVQEGLKVSRPRNFISCFSVHSLQSPSFIFASMHPQDVISTPLEDLGFVWQHLFTHASELPPAESPQLLRDNSKVSPWGRVNAAQV